MSLSLHTRFGAIFLGFLLLVSSSVTATFLAVREQVSDATVINLAGRQRMLTQKITWLALAQPDNPELAESVQRFDQTLRALRDGGPALELTTGQTVTLPPAPDAVLQTQLGEAAKTWAFFRSRLQPIDAAGLQALSPLLLTQLDAVVSGFEARAQAKLFRLQLIQIAFLVLALALLVWGYRLTRRRLLGPLAALNAAAGQVAGGQFAHPIPVAGDDELGKLGRAFETMQAEIAAAHEQLENRVAQRTRELDSAFEFSREIASQLDLEHLLRSVTDRACALMRAQTASLCLLTPGSQSLELAALASPGLGGEAAAQVGLRRPVSPGLAARVILAGETTVEPACISCGFHQAHPPGQCAAAPLRVGERTLGALCAVRNHGSHFDADETRALTLLANSAAIAIANARLVEDGRRQAEQAAMLNERERLAAELHDHLAQTLSFISLKTDRMKELLAANRAAEAESELERMRSATGDACIQVRAALTGLRQPPIEPIGGQLPQAAGDLADQLAACVADFRAAAGLPAELLIADPAALALPAMIQTQALRIVREALTNVRRHAQAHSVSVRVEQRDGVAHFAVEDDGQGFDLQRPVGDDHLGLAIMHARAERSGGQLTIQTLPGAGTKVIASFPVSLVVE